MLLCYLQIPYVAKYYKNTTVRRCQLEVPKYSLSDANQDEDEKYAKLRRKSGEKRRFRLQHRHERCLGTTR